jgi:hypothetical protein
MIDVCEFLEAFYDKFPVPSDFIGVVFNRETKEIIAVINPAYDWQLADHRTKENNVLLMKRMNLPTNASYEFGCAVSDIVERARKVLS